MYPKNPYQGNQTSSCECVDIQIRVLAFPNNEHFELALCFLVSLLTTNVIHSISDARYSLMTASATGHRGLTDLLQEICERHLTVVSFLSKRLRCANFQRLPAGW